MAEYIVMPKLGFDMREGVLVGWLKEIGDSIERGEVVAEIESDKATLELEAQANGTLLAYLEEPGAVVPIGANLAIMGEAGEDISAMTGGEGASEAEEAPAEASPAPTQVASAPAPQATGEAVSSEFPHGIKATPVARRVAQEHGVDLAKVAGSGPNGRIRKADVHAYIENPPVETSSAPAPAQKVAVTVTSVEVRPNDTVIETTRLRQAIARRMTESKTSVPHFYVTSEIDMEPALALRKTINAKLAPEKVSVNDMIVKAAALALRQFPNINGAFNGDTMVQRGEINVGTAVAVDGGLLTVVQKNTDKATLSTIAKDNRDMIARARSGKIHPDDVQSGTFTVSNLGAFDVENFIAIVNPPEAAILAIGSARKVPVVNAEGELAVGTRMKATISADHRATDGAEAAQFMQAFKGYLEEPMTLLL